MRKADSKGLFGVRNDGNGAEVKIRIVTAATALEIIADHNALIKNIATQDPKVEPDFFDPKNGWSFLLRQLQDPENNRPAKSVPKGANRKKIFDPEAKEWLERFVNPQKGQPKPGAKFTKKTATSLWPPSGKMNLFPQSEGIVILFDLTKCNIKQYIFDRNVTSDSRWWLYNAQNGDSKPLAKGGKSLPTSVTLDVIREQQIARENRGEIPDWNEILPGLSSGAVIGVVVPENDLLRRLNAQYRRLILLRELHVEVPILITTPNQQVYEYTTTQQLDDLSAASKSLMTSPAYAFFEVITSSPAQLLIQHGARWTISNDDWAEIAAQNKNWAASFSYVDNIKNQQQRSAVAGNLLHTAIDQNDNKAVEKLVANKPNVSHVIDGKTPIQRASELGRWGFVKIIAGSVTTDAHDTARYGAALLLAAKNAQHHAAMALVNAGAPIDCRNPSDEKKYYFAIHFAIYRWDPSLLQAILNKHGEKAANVQYKDCVSPLSLALSENKAPAVQLLMQHGARWTKSNDDWAEIAAQNGNWAAIYAYVDNIIHQQQKSEIAGRLLHTAIDQNDNKAVEKLVANKPNVSHVIDGKTPIQRASEFGRWGFVKIIADSVTTDADDTARYGAALLWAAKNAQHYAAMALVNAGAPIDCRNPSDEKKYYFAIHFAIYRWDPILLQAILNKHGKKAANVQYKNCVSPLSLALSENKAPAVQLLMQHSARWTKSNDDWAEIAAQNGNWAAIYAYVDNIIHQQQKSEIAGRLLHTAIDQNDNEAVEKLVANKPNVSHVIDGKTPIQRASELGRWGFVKIIAGSVTTDAHDTARYGAALLLAAKNAQHHAAMALVNAGAPIDCRNPSDEKKYYFAIHFAIYRWDPSLLQAILNKHGEKAANVQYKDCVSPLSLALSENKAPAVQLLMQHGARWTKSNDDWAEIAAQNGNWAAIYAYVDNKHQQQRSEIAGRLLHTAIDQNDYKAVEKLVANKPNVSHVIDGKTPIQRASELGRWGFVKIIADSVTTDADDTARYGAALLWAAKNAQHHAAMTLVNAGAPIDCRNPSDEKKYYFAIHFAIYRWDPSLLQAILNKHGEKAANVQYKDCVSPLSLALSENKAPAVQLLMQHGARVTKSNDDRVESIETSPGSMEKIKFFSPSTTQPPAPLISPPAVLDTSRSEEGCFCRIM